MSLINFSKNSYPFGISLTDFFGRESLFNNDFFNLEKSLPAMNVKEHDTDFEIELASPGFNKKDFEITLNEDILEVSAQKSIEEEEKEEDYTRKEFNYRSFRRSMHLPKTADKTKEVIATYKNGILKLHILKKDEAKVKAKRKIKVV